MKTKFNLDRKPLDSSFIQSRQDFDKVIKGYRAMKPPIWKNPWFYGPVGLASLAIILTLTFQNKIFASGNNSTLSASLQNTTNQLPDDTPCIKPPSDQTNVDFEIHPINPSEGGTIVTENGTKIEIASNSLSTTSNKEVIIKVREFPNLATAFAAGIPMDVGNKSAFESGGMIEIRGEQNGKLVKINPDAPIKVDMTLYNAGEGFTFWSLDDKSGEWTDYPCEFTLASANKAVIRKGNTSFHTEIKAIQQEIEICDKNIATIQNKSESTALIPTKNARKLVVDFDAKQFPELSGYQDIEFEYLLPKVQNAENMAAFSKSIKYASTQTWNEMAVSKKNVDDYLVTFKNRRESYTVPVRPVLKGASLAQLESQMASAENLRKEKIEEYVKEKSALEKREKELKAKFEKNVNAIKAELNSYVPTSQTTNIERSEASKTMGAINSSSTVFNGRGNFVTANFGVFNCDKATPYPKTFREPVLCKNESGEVIKTAGAYVFDHKKNTRFTFGNMNGRKIDELAWNKSASTLILIDMDGNMYYKRMINQEPLGNSTVILDRISRKDVSLDEIQKILDEKPIAA